MRNSSQSDLYIKSPNGLPKVKHIVLIQTVKALLYNNISIYLTHSYKTMRKNKDEHVLQVLQSTCDIDITYFPFDEQTCGLQFQAWSYKRHEVSGYRGPGNKHNELIANTCVVCMLCLSYTNTVNSAYKELLGTMRNSS